MKKMMTVDELADLLGVPRLTIYAWRTKGTGPVGVRVGKYLRFRESDVERWLEEMAGRGDGTRSGASL